MNEDSPMTPNEYEHFYTAKEIAALMEEVSAPPWRWNDPIIWLYLWVVGLPAALWRHRVVIGWIAGAWLVLCALLAIFVFVILGYDRVVNGW